LVTRRAVLAAACGVLALGATATPAAASTNVRTLPDGRLAVRVNRIPELSRVGGAVSVGSVKGTPVAVVRTSRGYRAMSLRCPHQGATVTRDSTGWVCPAHGSEFSSTGALELGPATTRLPRVPAAMNGGTLIVG
jgi:cytochrome b6-f complex iron-sulfur subunit